MCKITFLESRWRRSLDLFYGALFTDNKTSQEWKRSRRYFKVNNNKTVKIIRESGIFDALKILATIKPNSLI